MFGRIYDLTYQSILTPYNLLDNLKLDNYTNINYSKKNEMIICEIKCLIDDESWLFYYIFDKKNHLQEAFYIDNDQKVYLFNRKTELESLRASFNKKHLERKKA